MTKQTGGARTISGTFSDTRAEDSHSLYITYIQEKNSNRKGSPENIYLARKSDEHTRTINQLNEKKQKNQIASSETHRNLAPSVPSLPLSPPLCVLSSCCFDLSIQIHALKNTCTNPPPSPLSPNQIIYTLRRFLERNVSPVEGHVTTPLIFISVPTPLSRAACLVIA